MRDAQIVTNRVAVLQAEPCAGGLVSYHLTIGELQPAVPRRPSEFAEGTLPGDIERRLREWATQQEGTLTLCVMCEQGAFLEAPWESLPRSLGLDRLSIARLEPAEAHHAGGAPAQQPGFGALICGSPGRGSGSLPGVMRELTELSALLRDKAGEVTTLVNPTLDQLHEALSRHSPSVLHLASPGVGRHEGEPCIALGSGDDPSGRLTPSALCALVTPQKPPRLVVLSTCSGGLSMAHALTQKLGCLTIGWADAVTDDLAADFSSFFYERLLEGASVVEAVQAFRRRASVDSGQRGGAEPVVWVPSPDPTRWLPLGGAVALGRREPTRSGGLKTPVRGEIQCSDRHVSIDIDPLAALSPALLLNGVPPFQRLSIKTSEACRGVRLQIGCDTGSGASTYRKTLDLARGLQPVPIEGLRFPALHELARRGVGRRYINFVVSLEWSGEVLAEATEAVLWIGCDEWMDDRETWPFLPAFVQPDSDGVKQVMSQAVQNLQRSGEASTTFSGYQRRDPGAVRRQMRTLYATLRESPFCLAYIGPPSIPVYVPGSARPRGQRVRLPDEVITHKRGTCHDLALLFAACAEHVQIRPVIILRPGHTFFGFWTSEDAHQQFWSAPERQPDRSSRVGHSWLIHSFDDLLAQAQAGAIDLIETTEVTKHSTYEHACAMGARALSELRNLGLDAAVDVYASRSRIRPV